MSIRFTILGSGSSGNATLVSSGDAHVLVDLGLSGRETARRLREFGVPPEKISAIVVSHEHSDHCRGVAPFAKNLEIPVFITEGALQESGMRLDGRKHQRITSGVPFDVCGMLFTPFAVPHDSVDPLAFTIEKEGVKIGIILDLGYISNLVVEHLRGCDAMILESNHDVNMLKIGPYPWTLKQRIMSRHGHLSNDSVAEFLMEGFDGKARHVVLAHLSENNNLPDIALMSAQTALETRSGLAQGQTRFDLAEPDCISCSFKL